MTLNLQLFDFWGPKAFHSSVLTNTVFLRILIFHLTLSLLPNESQITSPSKDNSINSYNIFQAVDEPNPLLDPLIEVLPEVSKPGQEITVQGKPIFDWFDGLQCHNRFYYTYPGSQTISPFAESVIYIIFPEPLTLSHEQVSFKFIIIFH